MKKFFIMFFVILQCLFIIHVIYEVNTTEIVLLSGRLLGFEIERNQEKEQEGKLIPTSSQKLGTVTFIKKNTHEFAALGHSAMKNQEETEIEGICHEVSVDRIDKSYKNHIGHIRGTIKDEKQIGNVNKDNEYGIFGIMDDVKEEEYIEIRTASKYEIQLGEAELLISLDNKELKRYKIEILEINYFSNNKNIKVQIKDDELIAKTGGIVQGMSGAPIIQNKRLVGAINYADPKTPQNAYAIFIDKLI